MCRVGAKPTTAVCAKMFYGNHAGCRSPAHLHGITLKGYDGIFPFIRRGGPVKSKNNGNYNTNWQQDPGNRLNKDFPKVPEIIGSFFLYRVHKANKRGDT